MNGWLVLLFQLVSSESCFIRVYNRIIDNTDTHMSFTIPSRSSIDPYFPVSNHIFDTNAHEQSARDISTLLQSSRPTPLCWVDISAQAVSISITTYNISMWIMKLEREASTIDTASRELLLIAPTFSLPSPILLLMNLSTCSRGNQVSSSLPFCEVTLQVMCSWLRWKRPY